MGNQNSTSRYLSLYATDWTAHYNTTTRTKILHEFVVQPSTLHA